MRRVVACSLLLLLPFLFTFSNYVPEKVQETTSPTVLAQANGDNCTALYSSCQIMEYWYNYYYTGCRYTDDYISCFMADILFHDLGQCWNDYDFSCNYPYVKNNKPADKKDRFQLVRESCSRPIHKG